MACSSEREVHKSRFLRVPTLSKSVHWLSRNCCFKITENHHNIAIGGRQDAAGDVISSQDVNPT